jgi:sulfoxide reductase heme-binding subunit YedZ
VTGPDPLHYAWWLAGRASGVVALCLVALSVGLGLAMAARVAPRHMTRRLRRLHEHVALVGLGAIATHGLTLLGDRWLHPGLTGIAVPFAMSYRPVATGLGIIAGYTAALLGLSFYVRRRIGPPLWRKLHRLTVVVYVLGVVHTLGAGTDAASPWLRALVLATALPIVSLFARRLAPARRRPAEARGKSRTSSRQTAEDPASARA